MFNKFLNIFWPSKSKLESKQQDEQNEQECYWNEVPKSINDQVLPRPPWLILPHGLNNKEIKFYDQSECKVHTLNLPKQLHNGVCCGSSKGWLIIAKTKYFDDEIESINSNFCKYPQVPELIIFLFNPFSGVIHQLPPLLSISLLDYNMFYKVSDEYFISSHIGKIELSSADISECIVAGILNDYSELAFCRPGDKAWSFYEYNTVSFYVDILFCNGAFNVLTIDVNEVTDFQICGDIESEDREFNLKLIPYSVINAEYDFRLAHTQVESDRIIFKEGNFIPHLVESTTGELLLVVKLVDEIMRNNIDDDDNESEDYEDEDSDEDEEHLEFLKQIQYCKTSAFEVFRIEITNNSYKLQKLENIGNQDIFLATDGASLAVPKVASTDSTEGSCIFFVGDAARGIVNPLNRDAGVYFFDKRKIERSLPTCDLTKEFQSPMSWFTPTP